MGHKTLEKGGGMLDLWAIAPGINGFFIAAIFIVMAGIILNAFGLLAPLWGYVQINVGGTLITSLILIIIIIFAIWWMAKSPEKNEKE